MTDPRCLLRAVWYWLRSPFGPPTSSHNYVQDETCKSARVDILRCEDCGHYSVTWEPRPLVCTVCYGLARNATESAKETKQ